MIPLERAILEYLKTDDHIDFQMVCDQFAADELPDLLDAVFFLVQQKLAKYVRQDDMLCIHCTVLGSDALRTWTGADDNDISF